MKYLKSITFALSVVLLFSNCFELREEVNVKEDGTGDMKLIVNLSESKENVKKYLGSGDANGVAVPSQENIDKILNHVQVVVRGVKGLTNVEAKSDYNSYVFTISAQFDNVDAVNEAVTNVSKQLSYLFIPPLESKNFSYGNNSFVRHFDYPISPEEYKDLPSMQRYVMESARAVSIYRFGKAIREYTNEKATLSPSGKAIMLEANLGELASGAATLENQISF